jgi:hypothetical protein
MQCSVDDGCVVRRWRSDSLTVIKTPEGVDSNKIVKHAYSRYNLSIGIGLSQVRPHTFCRCLEPCSVRWLACASSQNNACPDVQLGLRTRRLVDSAHSLKLCIASVYRL